MDFEMASRARAECAVSAVRVKGRRASLPLGGRAPGRIAGGSLSVVEAGLEQVNVAADDPIREAMLLGDAPRPDTLLAA